MSYYSKQRKRNRNNRQLLILLIFVSLFYFAFNLGKSKAVGNSNYCASELQRIERENEIIQDQKIDLQKNMETICIERDLLQEKYDAVVLSDATLAIFNDINSKVNNGIDVDRIARSLAKIKSDRKCSQKIRKRFIVKNPLYKGDIKSTTVSFEKNVFDITADGYSFINEDRKPESWFSPEKPISVSFTTKKGTEVVKQDLPIKKAIILNNKEYFFYIEASSSKGFVNITEYSCNYP